MMVRGRPGRDLNFRRPRGIVLSLVALVTGLIVWALMAGAPERYVDPDAERGADLVLYEAINEQMAGGVSYYAAVAAEQAQQGYPTRPVMTVREPALAWLIDVVGGPAAARGVLLALLLLAALALLARLRAVTSSRVSWGVAGLLGALSLLLMTGPDLVYVHEIWAGALIVLSVSLRTNRRWVASVLVGLAATLIRELAVPYLAVMLVMAWRDGRRREAAGWAVACIGWAGFYGLHALRVMDLVPASALGSPGWLAFEGWPLFVEMIRSTSFLVLLPFWVAAVAVPLALLGWWSAGTRFGICVALMVTGYAAAFMVIGRADTVYWGFMLTALVLPGLAMVPRVLGLSTHWDNFAKNRDN